MKNNICDGSFSGKVRDLFVVKKRTKQGWRFGFVRFKGVARPKEIESTLDRVFIGNTKLHVNFSMVGTSGNQQRYKDPKTC